MEKCIFCEIANHNLPANIVFEDNDVMAFADINPATKGHLLVIPKIHFTNIFDVDDAPLNKILQLAKRIAGIMPDALGCSGVNLLHSAGESAWQEVMHLHLHIIPRYNREELQRPFIPHSTDKDELKEIALALNKKIKEGFK